MRLQVRLALAFACVLFVAVGCNPAGPGAAVLPTLPPPTLIPLPTATAPGETPPVFSLEIRDGAGAPAERTVDGNALRLVGRIDGSAAADTLVAFSLAGSDAPLGDCTIAPGDGECTLHVRADGWAWAAHKLAGLRTVVAATADGSRAETVIAVTPRPLVLVHGLNSTHKSWTQWIKPDGFLAEIGMPGYAVDDGQFGTRQMNTGDPAKPLAGTNSIAENAAVLAEYIEAVRSGSGAERVDLVAHSLGGLISRYYVQNLMPMVESQGMDDVPVVNQLIMAGTPNAGTPCGRIPAALGLFSPATTQITPEYLSQVFNPAVHDRRGVPFFGLAGDAVKKKAAIRCTEIPTDRYVSVQSVLRGVSVVPDEVDGFHSDLNNGRPSFERILALLARSPDEYPIKMDEPTEPLSGPPEDVQSTLVQGGTIRENETITLTITIDQARDASFILYAPGSAISMTIKTVAGAILTEETPQTNPNVTFERVLDDSLPLSLGYGVLNPRAGAWEIGLNAKSAPPGGGPFALVATLETDLRLSAEVTPGTVDAGQPVTIRARVESAEAPQAVAARALLPGPIVGEFETVELLDDGQHDDGAAGDGVFAETWTPTRAGEVSVQVTATGNDAAGNPFERLAVLGVSVR
jgi:pimeloyl-ACP methyl ester carboxylesterase